MLNLSCLSIKAEILGIYERKISIVFPEVLIFVNFLYSSLRYMILHFVPFLSYLTYSSYLLGSTSCPVWPFFLTWSVIMENQSRLAENVESTQHNSCPMAKSPVNYHLPSSLFSSSCLKVNGP